MRQTVLLLAFIVGIVFADMTQCRAQFQNSDTGDVMAGQLSASAPAGTYYSPKLRNQSAHALKCLVSISSVAAGGTLTVTLTGVDAASGHTYTLLASAALNSAGDTLLEVGPGVTTGTNTAASVFVPATWQVKAVTATAAVAATIGCSLLE